MAWKKIRKIDLFLCFCLIFLIISFFWLQVVLSTENYKRKLKTDLKNWEQVVKQEPGYPDGWAKLAIIWLSLGRRDLSLLAIKEARNLAFFRDDLKDLEEKIANF